MESLNSSTTSLTTNRTILLFRDYPEEILKTGAAFLIAFVLIGVIGNSVSIAALILSPKIKQATTVFIVNLCFADFLFSATNTTLAVTVFWNSGWDYSEDLCIAYGVTRFFNVGVSVFTLIAITINRYVIVVRSKYYRRIYTEGNNLLIVVATWLIPTSLIYPPTAYLWGRFGWDEEIGTCSVLKHNGRTSKSFLFMLAYFLPTTFFVVCYSRIYWLVRKTQKNLRAYKTSIKDRSMAGAVLAKLKSLMIVNGNESAEDAKRKVEKGERRSDKDMKVLKMTLTIFSAFTVCFLPLLVLKAFRLLDDYPGVQVFAYLTFYFSGCVNPFIYIYMSKEYRQAYMHLFSRRSRNVLGSSSAGSHETPL